MNFDDLLIKYPVECVTPQKFAELMGKSKNAVDMMVRDDKVPFIEVQDPEKPGARTEKLICIEEFNKGVRKAFAQKPKAQREAWLMWLGL